MSMNLIIIGYDLRLGSFPTSHLPNIYIHTLAKN
jgi:hypothetical protein